MEEAQFGQSWGQFLLALFVELEVDVERKYDRDVHLFA